MKSKNVVVQYENHDFWLASRYKPRIFDYYTFAKF